jgi:hypothetical protein
MAECTQRADLAVTHVIYLCLSDGVCCLRACPRVSAWPAAALTQASSINIQHWLIIHEFCQTAGSTGCVSFAVMALPTSAATHFMSRHFLLGVVRTSIHVMLARLKREREQAGLSFGTNRSNVSRAFGMVTNEQKETRTNIH